MTRGREAQWRPCRIEPAALKEVDDWLEEYRRFWDARLDRLEDYLNELQAKEADDAVKPPKSQARRQSQKANVPAEVGEETKRRVGGQAGNEPEPLNTTKESLMTDQLPVLVPHLAVNGARDAIEFYKNALGAVEVMASTR